MLSVSYLKVIRDINGILPQDIPVTVRIWTPYIYNLCSSAIFTYIFTSYADTCWRGRADSELDENLPPAKRQRTTEPQINKAGGAHVEGQQFEIKMAAVIGLRGMRRNYNFKLYTNLKDAGKFDDLVYIEGERQYCLQLKHTENPHTTYLQPKDLVKLLYECFKSYYEMKDEDKNKRKFIIYTNKELGPTLSKHGRSRLVDDMIDNVFRTRTIGEIFNFTPGNRRRTDVYLGVEELVKASKKIDDLSDQDQKHKVSMINEFLGKLIMVIGQKGESELDEVVKEEIRKQNSVTFGPKVNETELLHFEKKVENWWKNRNEEMTSDSIRNWLQEAKTTACTPVVSSLFKNCTRKLVGTGMRFSDSEISLLQAELPNNRAVHLRSDALTLCSILLLDSLDTSKCIFVTFESLQSNKNRLRQAWLGGHWEWLIVLCDSTVVQRDISETCFEISENITRANSSKRVIILTAGSVPRITDFVLINHEFKFEQLSKKSQEIVLDKTIDFQGCEVTMRSVLQRHGNVEHVLGPELVTDLITEGTAVNIGGTLQENTEHYETRAFKRKIWLSLAILKTHNIYPDIIAVSGMEMSDLIDIIPSDEEVGYFYFDEDSVNGNSKQLNNVFRKRFIVLKGRNMKSSFLKLCQIKKQETLHWLKYKDGKLLWKETRGDIENLLNSIDPETMGIDKSILRKCMKNGKSEVNEKSIWDLGERTVLVVAEPGMGKSSTTTQVAWHTKLADPTSWVVRINWNDHTRKLQEINTATFNFKSLVEFLCSAAFPESKYTDINRVLLKQALQNSENVTVLMDGFDEISPTHADKAGLILSALTSSKLGKIWVTSRPLQRKKLENLQSVMAFSLKKLSNKSQGKMLRDIWKRKANGKKEDSCLNEYVKRLLLQANESDYHRNFTGSPLHIRMIACAFEKNLETSLNSGIISLPDKLDLLELYDKSIERKLHTYETDKKREDLTNVGVQDDHERLMEIYTENLEKCSLLVTLPSELNPLSKEEIESKIQPFLKTVQEGKDKIGIVMDVVEDRPQFVHRTFAEYLTARWFSKNFKPNRSILERVLFDSKYGFVKNMLDRMLAKGYPLHSAVLDWNTEVVETLLQRSDVNAVDRGGRTSMHLIAAERCDRPTCEEITNSLLRHRDFVDAKDNVLECTALGYAIKTGNWLVVERLLERKYKTTDLELLRQRVEDESYMGKVIDDIKDKNYSLLLQYLASICANTQRAPSLHDAFAYSA